jgi:hypothetical protein
MKPRPVLCYDFDGGLELVNHLLGGPLRRGWKAENVKERLDARLAEYFRKYGGEHHALHDAGADDDAFF